ncbi:hypothetical protein ABEB36_012854 [Hypothenemus hampei]|uniref:PRKR-interacting protein 1 n=1 Tax=Hypothenemus hampei TaxID=57062 RepID=A0ABD1E600_HYPHA
MINEIEEDIDDIREVNERKPSHVIIRNAADLQRLKLEKLMKHPEKPVIIPEPPKERGSPHIPDFVRNVMGSSAGAGSGEFHVYRHLRRKEYARQKYLQEKARREKEDNEYKMKLEENKRLAEERTSKKRAKRLKKKKKHKAGAKKPKLQTKCDLEESDIDDDSDINEEGSNEAHDETPTTQKEVLDNLKCENVELNMSHKSEEKCKVVRT